MADRYVICGLAHVRSPWFRDVARWSNAAAIPADFVKCVSVEEVRARFASGRPFSVLMVDGGLAGVDRDLIDLATGAGAAVFVIDDGRTQRDWLELGATQVLPADLQRAELSDVLEAFATPVGGIDSLPGPASDLDLSRGWSGRIVAVVGPGGTGASTIAMALAQGLSTDPRYRELVLLADLALNAEQAMLHDARDIVPGLQELVDAHRTGVPSPEALRSLVFDTDRGHYHLLLGLRRHRDWAAIRPRAFEASLASIARAYRMVVADIEHDFEGQDEVGVVEVEERNHMARTVAARADLVLAVGAPGVKGLHSLVRLVNDLLTASVAADRIVPVINRAPRSGRARAELSRSFATLLDTERQGLASPLFVPERKRVEEAIRDGVRLPSQLSSVVTNTVVALLLRSDAPAPSALDAEPVAVAPGSLGSFFDQDEDPDQDPRAVSLDDVSPLGQIEAQVQDRAKDLALDMETDEGRAGIKALIDAEIGRWNQDAKRGLRPYDLADPSLVAERAYRNLVGYGPLGPLLDDDDVWEIMINAPDAIFVKRHQGPSGYHSESFHDDEHVVRTLTKILDDASGSHRKLDPTEGLQDAQLDTGARLHIVHSDVARGGHVMVNIRKFTGVAFGSLAELVERDMLSSQVAEFLSACVRSRLSIVFAGAPGSGKTTLMSCCCADLDPALRVVIAEEVFEADVPVANVASMQTRAARADRQPVDLRRLVAGFLRMAPDVAIVGEVRDREALPLLLTLSSGVTGYTTIHAGSARQALSRLRFICQLADTANELPMAALNTLVSESIDIVVHCVRGPEGPQVSSVLAVEDLQSAVDGTQFTVTELFARDHRDDPLQWTGNLPVRAERPLREFGYDVRALLDTPPAIRSVEA